MSDSESIRFSLGADPYYLLRTYARESKIKAYSYSLSEGYYRNLHKYLNYPVVVLSAISTVIAGLDLNSYAIMGLSLSMLILLGFDKLIDPKENEHKANQFKVEYGEINSNVKIFILNNGRTHEQVKAYAEQIHELINKWKSINPSVFQRFTDVATMKYTKKLRKNLSVRNIIDLPQTPRITGLFDDNLSLPEIEQIPDKKKDIIIGTNLSGIVISP